MERARREASYSFLNVFTAHRSETLFTGEERFQRFLPGFSSPCHFFPPLHHQRSPKKFTNTYEPLTSSPFRLTANSHPLNGTCHGSACPLTKDNCDLDKHWGGGKHKGKGQVLFQFKCAPIHLQHNGDKELQLPPFLKGEVITRFTVEEEDADSRPDSHENKRKSILHKSGEDSSGSFKATPPHLLLLLTKAEETEITT